MLGDPVNGNDPTGLDEYDQTADSTEGDTFGAGGSVDHRYSDVSGTYCTDGQPVWPFLAAVKMLS